MILLGVLDILQRFQVLLALFTLLVEQLLLEVLFFLVLVVVVHSVELIYFVLESHKSEKIVDLHVDLNLVIQKQFIDLNVFVVVLVLA